MQATLLMHFWKTKIIIILDKCHDPPCILPIGLPKVLLLVLTPVNGEKFYDLLSDLEGALSRIHPSPVCPHTILRMVKKQQARMVLTDTFGTPTI